LALYFNPELKYKNEPAASVGNYECINDDKASLKILDYAKSKAREAGFKYLISPMEGSTWNNYRFSDHNDHPNFFLEPYHHIYYNRQFLKAGFEPIAKYVSNIDRKLTFDKDRLAKFDKVFKEKGAIVRNIDLGKFEEELYRLGEFSIEAFRNNFLYTPIESREFVEKYLPIKKFMDPRLVWIVEDVHKEIHAFIFCLPDHFDTTRKTFIFKSMARKSDTQFRGITSYLSGKMIQQANALGYTAAIHAMMFQDNASVNISKNYAGEPYKSYTLYAIPLI
jgi:hypothetical protein